MNKILINIVTAIIATSISLLFAEMAVRYFAPQILIGSFRIFDDGISLNKARGDARHQLGERKAYYKFNKYHLRDEELKMDRKRILVVGDSFTFGWLLNKENTITNHLQEFIDMAYGKEAVQVLNGGAGGWGSDSYIYYTEKFGDYILPSMVVVILNTDDIGRSLKSSKYILTDDHTLKIAQKKYTWKHSLKRVLNRLPFYQWLLENSHLVQLIRKSFLQYGIEVRDEKEMGKQDVIPESEVAGDASEYALAYAKAIFKRLAVWCQKRDVQLIVTTTGFFDVERYDQHNSDGINPSFLFLSHAANFFESLGVPFYDISPEFQEITWGERQKYVIENDGHPNEAGSKLIASLIWKRIKEHIAGLMR